MILFSHIRDTDNTGDLMSCPASWFEFPEHRVENCEAPVGDCTAIIYGGGVMTTWLRGRQLPRVLRIAWGIGSSRRGETEPWPDPAGFDLVGVREWTEQREAAGRWVPCVSCMSPLFDMQCPIEHEAVLFLNTSPNIKSNYPVAVGGLPTLGNNRSMAEIVEFLASAQVVITNSYHGVIWATLLGRRVICVPYSSKFFNFRHPPAYSHDRGLDWRARLDEAPEYFEALDGYRTVNQAFYLRVMEIIGKLRVV